MPISISSHLISVVCNVPRGGRPLSGGSFGSGECDIRLREGLRVRFDKDRNARHASVLEMTTTDNGRIPCGPREPWGIHI